jgi:hypothetical protein
MCARIESILGRGIFAEQLRALATVLAEVNKADATTTENRLWEQISTFSSRLPGDAFFMDSLSPAHRAGYVACLRRIQEIHATQFTDSPLELERVDAVRISRMNAPYKYRLTQQLAAVFADIGLPDSHDASCKAAVKKLRSS